MNSYGSDRLRIRDNGSIEISSSLAKEGWSGRSGTQRRDERHPGTAVLWDGGCYEVVDVEVLAVGVRYTLSPWPESEAVRLPQRYDEEAEKSRATNRSGEASRVRRRRSVLAFSVLVGHLPARDQTRMSNELGFNASLPTIVSAVAEIAFAVWVLNRFIRAMMFSVPVPPTFLCIAALFLASDGAVRGGVAWLESRAVGSLAGSVVSFAWHLVFDPSPGDPTGRPLRNADENPRGGRADTVAMVEPILTLLDPRDQQRLAEEYGFEPLRRAKATAAFILLIALGGAATAAHTLATTPRISAWCSLASGACLAAEQIVRLLRLGSAPSASVLRYLVRPFVRNLLRER